MLSHTQCYLKKELNFKILSLPSRHFISNLLLVSLSIISLLILYPIMYKVYHSDADDMLSHEHIERLTRDTIRDTAEALELNIDWDLFRLKERELSIDVMVPYENTSATMIPSADVRSEILRRLLEEFSLFSGLFKNF